MNYPFSNSNAAARRVLVKWFHCNHKIHNKPARCAWLMLCTFFRYVLSDIIFIVGKINSEIPRKQKHQQRYILKTQLNITQYWTKCNNALQWRHNGRNGVWNQQPHHCLLIRLFTSRSKKTSKVRVTGLCARIHRWPGNSPQKRTVTLKMLPFDDVIMGTVFTIETLQIIIKLCNVH